MTWDHRRVNTVRYYMHVEVNRAVVCNGEHGKPRRKDYVLIVYEKITFDVPEVFHMVKISLKYLPLMFLFVVF